MNLRQFLRNLGHLVGELLPWQAVDVARGRDYDAAVLAAADMLADAEAEYKTLEPPGGDAGDDWSPQSPPPPGLHHT